MIRSMPCFRIPILQLLLAALAIVSGCADLEPGQTKRLFSSIKQFTGADGTAEILSLTRFSFGLDSREAIVLPVGAEVRVEAQIDRNAKLVFGFGLAEEAREDRGEIAFEVEADREGSAPLIVFRATSSQLRSGGWQEGQVDLSGFAQQAVALTFRTASDSDGAAEAVWSNPRIVYPRRGPEERNLILISIDTLRADHVNCYGYRKRTTTPNIDRLARGGVLFSRTYANAPWTTPSHMSLFTSLYPSAHGLNQPIRLMRERMISLNPDVVTLAQVLRSNGFSTAAFVSAGAISGKYGFWKGFDRFDETMRIKDSDVDRIVSKAGQWLAYHNEQRFFLFLHTYEVHAPSTHAGFLNEPGMGESSPAERASAAYDGDLKYADEALGGFFSKLKRLGLYDNSLIILLSDHGENLYDRMTHIRPVGHGFNLNEEMLRVPLIIAAPGLVPPSKEVGNLVELVDVMPTLLGLLKVRAKPALMQGRNLSPLIFSDGWSSDRPLFAEATSYGPERKAVRDRASKFVFIPSLEQDPYRQLPGDIPWDWQLLDQRAFYDLSSDPLELHNIVQQQQQEAERLEKMLNGLVEANLMIQSQIRPDLSQPDPKLLERLRSLGYIQ